MPVRILLNKDQHKNVKLHINCTAYSLAIEEQLLQLNQTIQTEINTIMNFD